MNGRALPLSITSLLTLLLAVHATNSQAQSPSCGNWTLTTNNSQSRAGAGAAWDPVNHRVLRFGGVDEDYLNDLWSYTLAGGWSQLATGGPLPSRRGFGGFLYDPVRSRMLLIGGLDASIATSDVWQLSLSGTPTWSQVATTGDPDEPGTMPTGRYAFSTIYDPLRDRLILFGGLPGGNATDELWELSLAVTPAKWTRLTPSGAAPAARYAHIAIYDPVRDRMIMYGGVDNQNSPLSDTWALSLSGTPTWTQLAPLGTAPTLVWTGAVYDPIRDRMLVLSGAGDNSGSIWSLSLKFEPAWFRIPAGGSVFTARLYHNAVYQPDDDLVLGFNGATTDGNFALTDTQRLDCAGGYWLETSGDHGTVSETPLKACYASSTAVSLSTQAMPNFIFQTWSGDASGNAQPLNVTMDANKVILAHFYTGSVDVGDPPLEFALEEIRPNPNPGPVEVSYSLARAARVKMAIYDLAGREVCLLASGTVASGRHSARWNGLANGSAAKSGIYFVRYETPAGSWNKRLVLLR